MVAIGRPGKVSVWPSEDMERTVGGHPLVDLGEEIGSHWRIWEDQCVTIGEPGRGSV